MSILKVVAELKRMVKKIDDIRTGIDATAGSDPRHTYSGLLSNALKYPGKSENTAVGVGSFLRYEDVCYYVKDYSTLTQFLSPHLA